MLTTGVERSKATVVWERTMGSGARDTSEWATNRPLVFPVTSQV
jgi:hypothetical protein